MDTYRSFEELLAAEAEFSIELEDRNSPVTILAPHGGRIEPHTSEIARLVAGREYNLFCFNGAREADNQRLHITSHRYDEQRALALVRKSATVVAIHGCTRREPAVVVGGLDAALREAIAAALRSRQIPVIPPTGRLRGAHRANICNQGLSGKGVQLEISRALRDAPAAWNMIAAAVRSPLRRGRATGGAPLLRP